MKQINYFNGQILGNNIKFLNEVERKRKIYKRANFLCHCGVKFECDVSAIKSLNTKSCGCLNTPEQSRKRETTHGMYGTVLYKKWISIKERCYRVKADNYHKYGGRGIKICDQWKNDFLAFYNYVIKLENFNEKLLKKNILSIDRIENNSHYMPGNLRITTWHIQSTNKRIQCNNKSGAKGVSFNSKLNKWSSKITVNGKRKYLGSFSIKSQAINARLNYIKENNLLEYL